MASCIYHLNMANIYRLKILIKLILITIALSVSKILVQYFLFLLGIHEYYPGYFSSDKFSWNLIITDLYFYGIFYFLIVIIFHFIISKLKVYNRVIRLILGCSLIFLPFTIYTIVEYDFDLSLENNLFLSNIITYIILGFLISIIYNSLM